MTPEDYTMIGAVIGLLIGVGGTIALRYTFGYSTGHADGYALAVAEFKEQVGKPLLEVAKDAEEILKQMRSGGAL